ncbi:MAG: molybdopterin-guanine dinucleotide biosynthesis protein B [Nitrososphaerales archaeon]
MLFLGFSGSGKTTALTDIAREVRRRKLGKVGTFKHVHELRFDKEGKDTFRHADSGASVVVSLSRTELAVIKRLKRQPSIEELIMIFKAEMVEYALVEGLYDSFSKRRGVVRVLCASTIKQVDDLLKIHHPKKILFITGKIANGAEFLNGGRLTGIPVLGARDTGRMLDLINSQP